MCETKSSFCLVILNMDKLTCTDYVDFGKCKDIFGQFSLSKIDSNYLDAKLKVFKKNDKDFRLVQNLTMGVTDFKDFNQFMRLRNQLVIATENFAREENFSPVVIPTMSEDMDKQFKMAPKVVEVVDRANSKICVTLLR